MPDKQEPFIPPLTEVASSNVHSHGYDVANQRLFVRFHSGGVYSYDNVPPEKYDDLQKADSVGRFIGAEIKGKHAHKRLNPKE